MRRRCGSPSPLEVAAEGVFRVVSAAADHQARPPGSATRPGARAVPRPEHKTSVIQNSLAGNTRR